MLILKIGLWALIVVGAILWGGLILSQGHLYGFLLGIPAIIALAQLERIHNDYSD